MTHDLRCMKSIVRRYSEPFNAQVDSQTSDWYVWFWRFSANRDVQVELALAENKIGGANFPCSEFVTHRRRQLQITRHAAFRADSKAGFLKVPLKSQRTDIEAHGRSLLELVLPFAVAGKGFRDLGDRVDHVLRWKCGLSTRLFIGGVVNVIAAMQLLLSGYFRNKVTSFRELTHSVLQFTGNAWRNYQLSLNDLLSFLHARLV